jgi:hypothetical protein
VNAVFAIAAGYLVIIVDWHLSLAYANSTPAHS